MAIMTIALRTLPSLAAWLAVAVCAQDSAAPSAHAPQKLDLPEIENAFRLSDRLYSGGDPRGDAAFRALKDLGVKTIISVDGAAPDAEAARRHGMRYVHLPIGYDSVPRAQAVMLVKAINTLPGPVYIHCHHGKHRGPAAAAVCGMAAENWTNEQALAWMQQAGTSPDYRGLFESVRGYETPGVDELAKAGDTFPERAEVGGLVESMVQIDHRWDHLMAVQKAGFRAPKELPDVDPPHEARLLVELFREAARAPDAADWDDDLRASMKAAETKAANFEHALRTFESDENDDNRRRAEAAFQSMRQSCAACHKAHRDNR